MTKSGGGDVRIGIDIGGTFTDVLAFDPTADETWIEKVPSTPSAPADGVVDGLEQLFDRAPFGPADVSVLSHGSTVTINALLEHAGARTGIVVTEGFTGVPLARHGEKPETDVKNPRYRQPDPYVPQDRVYEVPERIGADGEVVEPLDEAAASDVAARMRDDGVESVAVCLLFSFLNPDHELRLRELVRETHPDCTVSLSSETAPRIREYPRLSTTTISAYVDPILSGYLRALSDRLDALGVRPEALSMMLSHGGLTAFDAAADRPASTVLSGPAAGVQGALYTARLAGAENIMTMDMGGTSCDVAIAPELEPVTTTEMEIQQNPVSVPLIDVRAIGAGGGTIARAEKGRLRVGPASAGADPGPVCYGRGGQEVTVTDANAALGRLNPEAILGGGLNIDVEAGREAIRERIADPLDLSVVEAAAGVLAVVNDKMKKELSLALTRRGYDPRTFSLVTFGGAGPMHAPAIARDLSIDSVIVPSRPGINSAVGLLATDRKRLYERSRIDRVDEAPVESVFADLESTAGEELTEGGADVGSIRFERELELRYAGQSYELEIGVGDDVSPAALREAFDERHREAFGHVSDRPVETMSYRLTAAVETAKLGPKSLSDVREDAAGVPEPDHVRRAYFDGEFCETPVYTRQSFAPGATVAGPAIVEQTDTTLIVEPNMNARLDEYDTLVLGID